MSYSVFLVQGKQICLLQWTPREGIMDNGIKIIQIDKSQITLSYLMYVEARFLIIICKLLESVYLCPKVIPLSRFHCMIKIYTTYNQLE